jgi:hypothetical protein
MDRLFVKATVVGEAPSLQGIFLSREKLEELRARGYKTMNAYALYTAEQVHNQLTGDPVAGVVHFNIDVQNTWVLFGGRPEDVG